MTQFFILFLMTFWVFSCAQDPNYGNTNNNNQNGYNPVNYQGNPNSTPPSTGGSCSPNGGLYGGITCAGGSNKDPNFLNFLSNGTDIAPGTNSIGEIHCNPGNNQGILFRMKVTLNSPLNLSGQNNNLVMQAASSTFEIVIYDTLQPSSPIGAVFEGLNGTVNGNTADLHFIYNGNAGSKKIRVNGNITADTFSGTISFENEKYWDDRRPGAQGTLGQFSIATCTVFASN